jgi:hypothetical protein
VGALLEGVFEIGGSGVGGAKGFVGLGGQVRRLVLKYVGYRQNVKKFSELLGRCGIWSTCHFPCRDRLVNNIWLFIDTASYQIGLFD